MSSGDSDCINLDHYEGIADTAFRFPSRAAVTIPRGSSDRPV